MPRSQVYSQVSLSYFVYWSRFIFNVIYQQIVVLFCSTLDSSHEPLRAPSIKVTSFLLRGPLPWDQFLHSVALYHLIRLKTPEVRRQFKLYHHQTLRVKSNLLMFCFCLTCWKRWEPNLFWKKNRSIKMAPAGCWTKKYHLKCLDVNKYHSKNSDFSII